MNAEKAETPDNRPRRNPYTPWFVIIIFSAPVVGAYLLYFFGDVSSLGNNGELLDPIIDISRLEIVDEDDNVFANDELERKWHLVYFARTSCDRQCEETLTAVRQVNIAVGKNANRLRRLLVHLEKPDQAFIELIDREFPAAVRVNGNEDVVSAALQPVNTDLDSGDLYLVDPLGNIMMRFESGMNPKLMMKDLNKLFKVSQIG